MTPPMPVTIAIPTCERGVFVCDTIAGVLALPLPPAEILVVDQTRKHDEMSASRLKDWDGQGVIRWLRLDQPSIPHAMNVGLREAVSSTVLFLDDDVVPDANLVAAHAAAYESDENTWMVTGQVVQPEQGKKRDDARVEEEGLRASLGFSFSSPDRCRVKNVMAGNLSVRREQAIRIGGFDENFVGSAYRFETEFCRRAFRQGGKALYEPAARVVHLRAAEGGIRRFGSHRSSASPLHGVGDYYFALREGRGWERMRYMCSRPWREVATRFHLGHPWWIPVKLLGEARAFRLALSLHRRGAALMKD